MANEEQLKILKQGVEVWNKWREENHRISVDLRQINLEGENLKGFNLAGVDLSFSNLSNANLSGYKTKLQSAILLHSILKGADLSGAELQSANLINADLSGSNTKLIKTSLMDAVLTFANCNDADFSGAKINEATAQKAKFHRTVLNDANLSGTDFSEAEFIQAKLINANLRRSHCVGTNFKYADLTGCKVYGISAWDIELEGSIQLDLVITHTNEPTILADNIEMAQFVHLLINNKKIRSAIDTITSKAVLILGNFKDKRKDILDRMRNELRHLNLVPILFDFDKPDSKDLTGTVETLARMARFVIADLTDPGSIPHELATVIPYLRTTCVLPLKLISTEGYGMFRDLLVYPWVLKPHIYNDSNSLIESLSEVIAPANKMAEGFRKKFN